MIRRNGEHWMSRVWARRASPYVTRRLISTRVTANQITYLMIVCGMVAAGSLLITGMVGALLSMSFVQLYLLLDCVDGEVARWHSTTSPKGAYLDRLGHYVVEAALLGIYGVHVSGSVTSGWVSLSLLTALFAVITKAETDLVFATTGRTSMIENDDLVQPRRAPIRKLRRVTQAVRIHRVTGAIEASLLMATAAAAEWVGWNQAEESLAIAFLTVAAILSVAHGVSILSSNRLAVPN